MFCIYTKSVESKPMLNKVGRMMSLFLDANQGVNNYYLFLFMNI